MVMWCKNCGALLGVCEPLTDWSSDRTGLCPRCSDLAGGKAPAVLDERMKSSDGMPANNSAEETKPDS